MRGARVILKTTNPLSCQTESLGESQSQQETGRQIKGNATEQPAGGDGGGFRRTAGKRNKKGGKKGSRQMAAGSGARFTLRGNNYFGFLSNSVRTAPTGVRHSSSCRRIKKTHITAL